MLKIVSYISPQALAKQLQELRPFSFINIHQFFL